MGLPWTRSSHQHASTTVTRRPLHLALHPFRCLKLIAASTTVTRRVVMFMLALQLWRCRMHITGLPTQQQSKLTHRSTSTNMNPRHP